MNKRAPWLGVVVLALCSGSAQAQVKDVTDLLPAQTLAYVEFRHADRISKEIASLLKGSYLDDMPTRMAKFRELRGDNRGFFFDDYMVGWLSLLLSPEMIAEAARLQSGAVALLGFDKERNPEIVGILMPGESNGPTFMMRAYLSMSPDARKVGEVEGVILFRERGQDYSVPRAPGQPPPPPVFRERGPTFALLPGGTIVIGSTTESVKQVVRRIKGRNAEPALSNVAAIKEAAKLRDRPGFFGYADMDAINAQLDDLLKDNVGGPSWNLLLRNFLNPRAARNAVASLSLENGNADLQVRLTLDPKHSSPLLDLVSDKKVNAELLHYVPKDALIAAAMSFSDGEKRWEKIVAMLDALAKAHGESDLSLPSKMIAGAEEKLKVKIGKDVLSKITGFAYAFNPHDEITQGGTPLGMLSLSAGSAEDAQYLEEFLPRLVGLFSRDEPAAPTRETIQGVKISSLPGGGQPWGTALHYSRQGATLVIGQDRRSVAAALVGGPKREGWLGEPRATAAVKELREPVAVGMLSLSQTLVQLLNSSSFAVPKVGAKPIAGPGEKPPAPVKPAVDPAEKYAKELRKVTEPLPPVIIALERQTTSATMTVRQVGLKGVTAKVIDVWIDAMLEQMLQRRGNGPGGFGIGEAPARAVPVAPEKP